MSKQVTRYHALLNIASAALRECDTTDGAWSPAWVLAHETATAALAAAERMRAELAADVAGAILTYLPHQM